MKTIAIKKQINSTKDHRWYKDHDDNQLLDLASTMDNLCRYTISTIILPYFRVHNR